MQEFITRRRLDGSIDLDFYRQRGLMERRMFMTRFFKGMGKLGKPFIAAGIVVLAISMMPTREGAGWNAASNGAPMSAGLTTATR